MSVEHNKVLARRWHDIWDAGDLALAGEVLDPHFIDHARPGLSPGPASIMQRVGTVRTAFPDLETTVEDLVATEDKVAARWIARGTQRAEFMGIPATNLQRTVMGVEIFLIKHGKLAEHWEMTDTWNVVLQQLGILEPPDQGNRSGIMLRVAFPDLQTVIDDLVAEGDSVATRWTARATHRGTLMGIPATGKQVRVSGISLRRPGKDSCVEEWTCFDTVDVLQQLGVLPGPQQAGLRQLGVLSGREQAEKLGE